MQSSRLEELMGPRAARIERRRLLAPMDSFGVLDIAFQACQATAGPMFRASAGPVVAVVASLVFLASVVVPQATLVRGTGTDPAIPLLAVVSGMALALPLLAWALASVMDAAVPLVGEFVTGEPVRAKRSSAGAAFVSLGLAWGPLAYGLAALFFADYLEQTRGAGGGVFLFFTGVSSLVFAVPYMLATMDGFGLAPVVSAVEGLGPWAAVSRAFRLRRRVVHYGPGTSLLLVLLLLAVLCPVVLVSAALPFLLVPAEAYRWLESLPAFGRAAAAAVEAVPVLLALAPVPPVWCCTAVVSYYARRVCVDGYDITVLAEDMKVIERES